jgi:hypothetical protein
MARDVSALVVQRGAELRRSSNLLQVTLRLQDTHSSRLAQAKSC